MRHVFYDLLYAVMALNTMALLLAPFDLVPLSIYILCISLGLCFAMRAHHTQQ